MGNDNLSKLVREAAGSHEIHPDILAAIGTVEDLRRSSLTRRLPISWPLSAGAPFEIDIACAGTVVIVPSQRPFVTFSRPASANIVIEAEWYGNRLEIAEAPQQRSSPPGFNNINSVIGIQTISRTSYQQSASEHYAIAIGVPSLPSRLCLKGVANVFAAGACSFDDCALELKGTGQLVVSSLGQRVGSLTARLMGVGNMDLGDVLAGHAIVSIQGVGNVTVGTSDKLTTRVTGLGTVIEGQKPVRNAQARGPAFP